MLKDFSELNKMVDRRHWIQRDVHRIGSEGALKTKGNMVERPRIPTQPYQGMEIQIPAKGKPTI